MEDNKSFEYTYSAKEQEEIEKIRRKYVEKEENKLDKLRKLDKDVTKPGTIWSLVVGIVGCLILGTGMCCCLVWADKFFVLGIIVGIIGMIVMGIAYPLFVRITNKQREKIAPIILELTEELKK